MKNLKEVLKYSKKGITLISLVVTIVILIILTSVTINILFGKNGLITMAQKAKNEYENAAINEEQHLAGIFEKDYATYNGQLHVKGTKLMNKHNEEVRLKGTVLANSNDGKFTKKLLNNLKRWGTNVIKVGLWSTEAGQSGIYTDETRMQEMYQIIDDAIDLNMYVIVIFWSGSNLTENVYNEAIDYFTQIASRYKDTPNLIYEIANEPAVEWEEIKKYANTIIPIIRNISPNSLILCPTQGHNSVHKIIGNTLNYSNIMYVSHVYAGMVSDRGAISTAILNNIPVFVSEWSNGDALANTNNQFDEETYKFIALMDKYNLSSTFFILAEINREGSDALVKQDCWDYTLNDDTLSVFGIFAKKYINGTYTKYVYGDLDYLMASNVGTDHGQYFWEKSIREKITTINTINTINIPLNAIYVWDISNEKNGNVIAYITDDNTGNGTYNCTIASNENIIYAYDNIRLFRHFINCKKIDLTYLDTKYVTNMREWFGNNSNLEEIIGLNNFNTSNITNMYNMFAYCSKLKTNINLSDVSNVTNMNAMFLNCQNILEINFERSKFNANIYSLMFSNISPKIAIYVNDIESARWIQERLNECNSVGTVYYGTEENWTEYIE